MTVYGIISKLDNAGIKVWVDSGQLKVKAPKGALTKALKAELVEYKAELLQFLPTVGAGGKKEDAIPLIARDGDLALSYAQKRMWFLAQLEPSNTAYHIRTALEIRGALDIHALQRAIKKLKHRHESLRTTFIETDGVPLQRINPEAAFVLPVEQLGEDNLKTLFSQFVDAPFDLETGPLFRADLVQLADDHYALMIAMHHIISDGWSTAVMVGELSALYASCSMNLPDALPAVAIQYVDYAYWQKSWLSGEREDRQLKYWTHQLADVPVLELLTDFSRPPVKSTAGGLVSFELDSVMAKQAKAMAQEKRATLFMVLLSAFNCLLYRYTGQTDFAVGSPIANRPNAQFEGTVGLFVNTLAMRARFNEGDSYADHLSSVRSMSLDAFEHQDIPFERIVDVMGVSRDMSHTPIFQVMFVLQNTPGEAKVKLPGVVVEELKFDRDTSPMDITMTLVEEKDGSISGELEYCTDLFSPETAQQICRHYVSFLQGVLNNPSQLVVQVDYLSAVEKQCLLQRWGTQQQSYDSDQTLDG
ncbi:MAG: non-ribosomal peptide synthetase, partial [Pseudomonadales bacterium]|nr:non-ribosomal peptide synthetase [Pseudomonadales bacterium]